MYMMHQKCVHPLDYFLYPFAEEAVFGRSGRITMSFKAGCFGVNDLRLDLGAIYTHPRRFRPDLFLYLKIPHYVEALPCGETYTKTIDYPAIDLLHPAAKLSFRGCCLIGCTGTEPPPRGAFTRTEIELVRYKRLGINDLWVAPRTSGTTFKDGSSLKDLFRPYWLACQRPRLVGAICYNLHRQHLEHKK